MSVVFNNPTDRPSSFVEVDNPSTSKLVRLVEDPSVEKTIRFDEMSVESNNEHLDVQGGEMTVFQRHHPASPEEAYIQHRFLRGMRRLME